MIAKSLKAFAAALWLCSCIVSEQVERAGRAREPLEPGCTVPTGWAEIAARKSRYIVFGEIHGTRESPAFLGKLACGLASSGARVLVAVELNATDNAALQEAWSLPHSQFPTALRALGWAGRQDGVASEAMFRLLQRLHKLKSQGRAIDLVAFNGFRNAEQRRRFRDLPAQGPHEAAQAENIREAGARRRYDHVLVLVGNLHARKMPVGARSVSFKPMAMLLGPPNEVTTLNMRVAGGTMWNCVVNPGVSLERGKPIAPGAVSCGNHRMGSASMDLGPKVFVKLGAVPGEAVDPNHDGFYWLGKVTGSPPAVPRH